jgi:hypothetical protein
MRARDDGLPPLSPPVTGGLGSCEPEPACELERELWVASCAARRAARSLAARFAAWAALSRARSSALSEESSACAAASLSLIDCFWAAASADAAAAAFCCWASWAYS